jgi:GR25 family glycosyltransferase involved in LPS biosynthesis
LIFLERRQNAIGCISSKTGRTYDETSAKALQRQGKPLNLGEIACSLSHRMIYQEMVNQGWKKFWY